MMMNSSEYQDRRKAELVHKRQKQDIKIAAGLLVFGLMIAWDS